MNPLTPNPSPREFGRRLIAAAECKGPNSRGEGSFYARYVSFTKFILAIALLFSFLSTTSFADDLETLIKTSCIDCHDSSTDTGLDLTALGKDFEDEDVFRAWVRIFDRVDRGEMPPAGESQPDDSLRIEGLKHLKAELTKANLASQKENGRVPSRRLSRQEYEYTLHDLLGIGGDIARYLPPENESGSFDVVAKNQEMSSVHVRGLLTAADKALDEAIQIGPKPNMKEREIDYFNSRYIKMWIEREIRRGGGTVFKTDRDVVTFRGENFVFRSDVNGFVPPVAGNYRISVKAAPYQQRSSITVSLKLQNDAQGKSELFAAWDLGGSEYREVSTIKYLRPDDYIYISADELEPAPNGAVIYNSQPAEEFKGEGVKIRRVSIEGPLESVWPPQRTRDLLVDVKWQSRELLAKVLKTKRGYRPVVEENAIEHTRKIVNRLATKAFGRELSNEESEDLVALARPGIDSEQNFIESVRVPFRAILVSPDLIFLSGDAGPLNNRELARRLSYFLWRSLPDNELMQLAEKGELVKPEILSAQVNRMLLDPKSTRFINDFLDQWLDLDKIDSTTPDVFLYPEYDDVLRHAMLSETREFFKHVIAEDLSVTNLVDSDFTFLNRKLAEHYGITGVEGETMRKVKLDSSSVRGGILSHASIAKVTANGTVTTPVKRGNFVLTNLLGLPPSPPPPSVGSIEPDTRGATTIREMLQKHKNVEACAVCHREIDPPGFAMESFDPVGLFRNRYRNTMNIDRTLPNGLRLLHKNYRIGLRVDASGATSDGFEFDGIREYKSHLEKSKEQIARNFVSKLIAFSTGAEVQFADRDVVEEILQGTENDGYPMRSLIHQIVTSRLFRNR